VISKEHSVPVLNGLVLAGGKSTRMGFDKGAIDWHSKPQRYYMADMLKDLCSEVFISCRADQEEANDQYQKLEDIFTNLGPYGAILSALKEKSDCAWLVVACDLPLLDKITLQYLIDNRDPAKLATAFGNGYKDLPEPLITIWEPKSYLVLLSFLEQGISCPRKVLINTDPNLLIAPNVDALTNVNTPEELEKVKAILKQTTPAI
jgi:molybdopterin-guanine dinucleotide biosynthesis protein A